MRFVVSTSAALIAVVLSIGVLGCDKGSDVDPLEKLSELAFHGKSCSIWTDNQGVPHARADTELAVFSCWGYLHGRDRAWQMDYFRRTAQGRRAEILGPSIIRSDFLIRAVGLAERAKSLYEKLPDPDKLKFSAYTHGVNLGFKEAEKSGIYELKQFGGSIESWTPSDSIALILLQSFDQTRKSFEVELTEETQAGALSHPIAKKLFDHDDLPWDTSVLKPGEFQAGLGGAEPREVYSQPRGGVLRALASRTKDEYITSGIGEGSNNWVIGPSRSATGHAWLANDPHLSLKYPPFWHWAHIEGGELDVMGASLPGVPVVTSGSNRKVAWGLTNAYLPVADIVRVPASDLKNVKSFRPVIWVKFWKLPFCLPMFFKTYTRTEQNWPVLPVAEVPGKATVLRWSGFDLEPTDLDGLFEVMHSHSVSDTDIAFAKVGVPTWNFVYADISGGIGYRAIGKTPKHTTRPAFGIVNEPLEKLEKWTYLTPSEMPHLLKPARGYIVTANNRQWPTQSAFQGGHAYADGFRAFRIEEMITTQPKQNLGSLQKMQCDVQSMDLRFLLPELLKIQNAPTLTDWKREAPVEATLDSRTLPLYRRWVDLLEVRLGYDSTALFHALQSNPEMLTPQIRDAYQTAIKETEGKSWGEIHRNSFQHLAGDNYFPTRSIPTIGDAESVNPGTMTWHQDHYEQSSGASQRLIVEMTNPPTIYQTLAGPNKDEANRDLTKPEFKNWANCTQEKRIFPLDWTKVHAAELKL